MAIPTNYRTYLIELARRLHSRDETLCGGAMRQLISLPPNDQRIVLEAKRRLELARLLYEQKDEDSFYQDRE